MSETETRDIREVELYYSGDGTRQTVEIDHGRSMNGDPYVSVSVHGPRGGTKHCFTAYGHERILAILDALRAMTEAEIGAEALRGAGS